MSEGHDAVDIAFTNTNFLGGDDLLGKQHVSVS